MARPLSWIACVTLIAACARVAPPSGEADDAEAPDGGAAGRRTFDPRGYSTSCSTTSDCMIAPVIAPDCFTCCGAVPVNAAAAQADLAAVEQACAGAHGDCAMGCEPSHAECVEGECVACTERRCQDGVMVHAPVATLGTHVLEAVVDGTTMGCTIELPVSVAGPARMTCAEGVEVVYGNKPGVFAEGVLLRTKTSGAITFRAKHDGALVGEKTFDPVYVAEAGPNGPHCAPKECFVAQATFP